MSEEIPNGSENVPKTPYDGVNMLPTPEEYKQPAETEEADAASVEAVLDDLQDLPEEIRDICLRQREIMAMAHKKDCSCNLFAANDEYRSRESLNSETPTNENGVPQLKKLIAQSDFWSPERAQLQEYGIQRQLEDCKVLSERMRAAERKLGLPPTIYILRGASGSGKTYACTHAGFPGISPDEKLKGTLATDNSKDDLYKAGGTSDQIHTESAMMYKKVKDRWEQYVLEKGGDCSEIHDRVFDDGGDIDEMIEIARKTGRRICVLDIDVPHIVSAVRVLQRPKGSPEPHPGSGYLRRIFKRGRINRGALEPSNPTADQEPRRTLMDQLRDASRPDATGRKGLDVEYRLICYDFDGNPPERQKPTMIAKIDEQTGQFKVEILDEKLYRRAVSEDYADGELEDVGGRLTEDGKGREGGMLITQKMIDWYCSTYCSEFPEDAEKARGALSELVGRNMTVYEALDDRNL